MSRSARAVVAALIAALACTASAASLANDPMQEADRVAFEMFKKSKQFYFHRVRAFALLYACDEKERAQLVLDRVDYKEYFAKGFDAYLSERKSRPDAAAPMPGAATPQLAMNYFSGYVEGWVAGAKGQVILNKDIVCRAAREVSEQILADTKTPSH